MKLYTFDGSANGRKVHCLISYLGLDVDVELVDLMNGEQRAASYTALNPNARVPTLQDGDFVLTESNAILLYLADTHPHAGLMPTGAQERANLYRWLFWQSAHFGPTTGKLLGEVVFKRLLGGEPNPDTIQTAEQELHRLCAILDAELDGKEFVCGSLSPADFALGAWAEWMPKIKFSLGRHARVSAWLDRVRGLNGWLPMPAFG